MVARLTPDQKVACSNHVGVTNFFFPSLSHFSIVSNHSFVSVFIFIFLGLVTFHPLLTKLSFAGCQSSAFQICPVRNLPAALPPDFSCFVLFFGLCSKYYMVAERPGNTYYGNDVKGFIQEFFLREGKCRHVQRGVCMRRCTR